MLAAMLERGDLTPQQLAALDFSKLAFARATLSAGSMQYFVDWVLPQLELLIDDTTSPLEVWTTIDPAMQQAALEAVSVKDFDLAIDKTKRAAELRETADYWFARADSEDALSGENDVFNLFDMAGPRCSYHELAERCNCRVLF